MTSGTEKQVAWRGVVPAFLVTTVGMLPGLLIGALAVQIRDELDLGLGGLGLVIGTFFGSAALASPVVGPITERRGWPAGLLVASVLTAGSLAGIGWLAESPMGLAAFCVVGGLGSSLGQVASNLAVARCVDSSRQGLVFGIRHAAVPTAAFLAGLAVPTVALTAGWRWVPRGASVLALLAAATIPRQATPLTINPAPAPRRGTNLKPQTPMRLLVILAIAVGLGTGAADMLASFLVSYSVEAGISEEAAGLLLAAGSLSGLTMRVASGWLVDRRQETDLAAVAALLAIGAVGVSMLNNIGGVGLVLGALLAMAAGWGWAGLFTFAVVKDNPEAPATASGITQTGKYLGAALGPPIFGSIADRVSFSAAWWLTTTVLVCAAALILYVRSQRQ